jgi:hypothetical protein
MRIKMKKRDRHEYVMQRARELAQSGEFDGWIDIEFELRNAEGLEEAKGWLDSRFVREELDQICKQNRKSPVHDA